MIIQPVVLTDWSKVVQSYLETFANARRGVCEIYLPIAIPALVVNFLISRGAPSYQASAIKFIVVPKDCACVITERT